MAESLVIHNAHIRTGTGQCARSMLVRDGRIAMLADRDITFKAADRIIDAHGCTIAPGLIDAHMHLITAGHSLAQLDLSEVTCREQFEAAIAQQHAQLDADQWLIAYGWSADNWGGPQPDKSWLASAGERPAVCYRMDLHVALVNDAVLARCDLSHDPPGGCIKRDNAGQPTGLMVEAAAWQLVNPLVPQPDVEAKKRSVLAAQQHAHALGITSVGSMEYARDVRDVLQPLRDELSLHCRITLLDRAWPMSFDGRDLLPVHDATLGVIGYKAFIDGTLGSRTARMLRDYADDPGNRGMLVELAAEGHLRKWTRAVADAGFSPSMHAIGDEAVRMALDAIEGIDPASRPRIEHAQQIDAADVSRFSGVIASMQPLHRASDGRCAASRLGTDRLGGFFPFRSLLDAGATLAFGSDWPVVSCDPIAGMRAAVTGLTMDDEPFQMHETLTPAEALAAYTSGAAYALQLENAGVLRAGSLADAVMFDVDPITCDWAKQPPRVVTTIAAGKVVYDCTTETQNVRR